MSKKKTAEEELSPEQLQEIHDAFCHFDDDGSGTIDVDELGFVLKTLGQELSDEDLQDLIKTIDVDGSGTIDFPEFVSLMVGLLNQPVTEEEIKAAFEVFDVQKNGYITATELKRILTTMGEKMSVEEADEMIAEADIDGDGKIDYLEFSSILSKN